MPPLPHITDRLAVEALRLYAKFLTITEDHDQFIRTAADLMEFSGIKSDICDHNDHYRLQVIYADIGDGGGPATLFIFADAPPQINIHASIRLIAAEFDANWDVVYIRPGPTLRPFLKPVLSHPKPQHHSTNGNGGRQ